MRKGMARGAIAAPALALLCVLSAPVGARADALTININTSGSAGSNARLELSLFDGDGTVNNTVQINNLMGASSFGLVSCTIGCFGGPPYVLDDSLGLGQFLQDMTLGTNLSFNITFTRNFTGGAQDQLRFFLLDPLTNFTLAGTNLSGDAVGIVDLGGQNQVQLAQTGFPTSAVPEPSTFAVLAIVLPALLATRKRLNRYEQKGRE